MPADMQAAEPLELVPSLPPAGRRRTFIPLTAWVYVLLAPVAAVVTYLASGLPAFIASENALRPIMVTLAATGVLSGAALHVRHPSAWWTLRPIAIAVALATASTIAGGVVGVLLTGVWLLAPDTAGTLAVSQVLLVGSQVLAVASTGLFWLGLHRVRFHPNRPAQRLITAAIVVIAVINASSVLYTVQYAMTLVPVDQRLVALGRSGLSAVNVAFAAGLTVTLVAGAWAREAPRAGWVIAAGGRVIVMVASIVLPLVLILARPAIDAGGSVAIYQLAGGVGSLSMFVALTLGFPAEDAGAAH